MSTRCLIGAETESGTKAVYVHSDGYPDGAHGKVETLRRMVQQYGLGTVVGTLLQTTSGWSSFDGEPGSELPSMYSDGRFELVPGFGVRYTLDELDLYGQKTVQGNTEYDGPGMPISFDIDYVYVFTADGNLKWAEGQESWDSLRWNRVEL